MQGVPAEFRVYVWTQLLPNRADIQHPTYLSLLTQLATLRQDSKAQGKMAVWMEMISRDVPRTFPELKVLSANKEQAEGLERLLGCLALSRADIGYVQGLSVIGYLLLQELGSEYK